MNDSQNDMLIRLSIIFRSIGNLLQLISTRCRSPHRILQTHLARDFGERLLAAAMI
jgi:hypothetical protein